MGNNEEIKFENLGADSFDVPQVSEKRNKNRRDELLKEEVAFVATETVVVVPISGVRLEKGFRYFLGRVDNDVRMVDVNEIDPLMEKPIEIEMPRSTFESFKKQY